ncbi:M10 family metallopeptidase C-terminal domain-containing protein [Pseudomonas synxantha]|nr:M10 family metallopeptidase C-terminal domain-containing protein [Pseudomonas synxantha]
MNSNTSGLLQPGETKISNRLFLNMGGVDGNVLTANCLSIPKGEETKPKGEQPKPASEQTRPTGDRPQPFCEETVPKSDQCEPAGGKPKPVGFDAKTKEDKTKPTGVDTSPTGGKPKAAGEETRPQGDKTKPTGVDTSPTGGKPKAAGEETRPQGDKTKPTGVDTSPTGGKPKVAGGETNPKGDPAKPQGDQPRPSVGFRPIGPDLPVDKTNAKPKGPDLSVDTTYVKPKAPEAPVDTIYGFNSNTGRPETTLTSATDKPQFNIWDKEGVDTFDFSGFKQDQIIDLRSGALSSVGGLRENVRIGTSTVIENAVGGSGNDRIIGNSADNVLIGGAGADNLVGGGGWNTFKFNAFADSTRTQADLLLDFNTGQDKIDLSQMAIDGKVAFNFVEEYTGKTGDTIIKFNPQTGRYLLAIDLDGDGKTDFLIKSTRMISPEDVIGLNIRDAGYL